jgi:hypothetical protein
MKSNAFKKIAISVTVLFLIFLGIQVAYASTSTAKGTCPALGKSEKVGGTTYSCSKVGKKLIWTLSNPSYNSAGNKRILATITSDELRSKVSFGSCSALLPKGYTTANATNSSAGEFVSPDKKYYGAWAARPINTSQLQTMSDQQLGIDPKIDSADPKTQILATAGISARLLGYDTTFVPVGTSLDSNGYSAFEARSSNARAILIYKNPVIQGDGYTSAYIAIDRIAIAPISATDKQMDSLARDTLSIQCAVQYSPPSSSSFTSSSHSSRSSGIGSSPTTDEENATLGTTWLTDDNTGEIYNVPLSDWSRDPCGSGQSGWAKVVGNSCTVLGH